MSFTAPERALPPLSKEQLLLIIYFIKAVLLYLGLCTSAL
jgi:hypothetical protein